MGRAAALGASRLAISTLLGERRRTCRRHAEKRRGAEARPRRRQHYRQPRFPHNDRFRDDRLQSRHLELPREMGPGRKTCIRNWRKAGSRSTAPRIGSSTCARASSFSNGKEFAADDAIYSLNLHRGDTKSGAAGPMKDVSDIKKLDRSPGPDLACLRRRRSSLWPDRLPPLMVPNGFKDWAKPVGTGPFTLEKFDPAYASAQENSGLLEAGPRPLDASRSR